MTEIKLSQRGKLYSYTVIMQRPPADYEGDIPYAIGYVELPEGVRIQTLLTGCAHESLRIDMEVELIIEKLHEDEEGNEVIGYKFKLVV